MRRELFPNAIELESMNRSQIQEVLDALKEIVDGTIEALNKAPVGQVVWQIKDCNICLATGKRPAYLCSVCQMMTCAVCAHGNNLTELTHKCLSPVCANTSRCNTLVRLAENFFTQAVIPPQ
jgi:hypothetical protein